MKPLDALKPVIYGTIWRLVSESNRRKRSCSPLHDHSANQPCEKRILPILVPNWQTQLILIKYPCLYQLSDISVKPLRREGQATIKYLTMDQTVKIAATYMSK